MNYINKWFIDNWMFHDKMIYWRSWKNLLRYCDYEKIKVSVGKRYKMSPSKLIKRFTKSSESIDELEKEDKTFFCSELIAAAYIHKFT